MESAYTQRVKKRIGENVEGRTDYFGLNHKQTINMIKEKLAAGNHSCNFWTFEWDDKEIGLVDRMLTKEGIVHCWDEVMDSFICFKSVEDMKGFYMKLRVETPVEKLKEIAEKGYNTPLIKFFK